MGNHGGASVFEQAQYAKNHKTIMLDEITSAITEIASDTNGMFREPGFPMSIFLVLTARALCTIAQTARSTPNGPQPSESKSAVIDA
jgi:hypothetical protein